MLQDIGQGRFDNQFHLYTVQDPDMVLLYSERGVLGKEDEGLLQLPSCAQLGDALGGITLRYAFSLDQTRYFYGFSNEENLFPAPDGFEWIASRHYREMVPQDLAYACCVGESLQRWRRSRRFCGRCGTPVTDSTTERAVVCPACGLVEYPKICPAVIAAVTDGDRLVLTKYRGRAFRKYALVAGFNEIGESIEDTVRREVLEETGLRVKDITFYKSQPWVVTDTLLMGFFCKLDGPDTIHMQEDELSVAQWFHRSQIPDDYSAISLTGEMIEVFRRGAVF